MNNRIKKIPLILILLFLYSHVAIGQGTLKISIPDTQDKFSEYVKKLEAGYTDIDYKDFRESFLSSDQYKIAQSQTKIFDSLEQAMYNQMDEEDYKSVVATTIEMLNIDYTSMLAHKILRQTYDILEEPEKAEKYKLIQFGLLKSIVQGGDGKSCETAWPVIQIEEEYFIMDMLGAELVQQSLEISTVICDKMNVKLEGKMETYYFDVSRIFAAKEKVRIK